MKLRPKETREPKLVFCGWFILGFCMSILVFGIFVAVFPSLRNGWGLLLFVPFSVMFTVAYRWLIHTHATEIAKKLGVSKEEQRRRTEAILGKPHHPEK